MPPDAHPCRRAEKALKQVGYSPEVIKSYGSHKLPNLLNRTEGRREARRLTGKTTVPVLLTDDDEVVSESGNIVRWAEEHPANPSTR